MSFSDYVLSFSFLSGAVGPISVAVFVKHNKNTTQFGRKVEYSCPNSLMFGMWVLF